MQKVIASDVRPWLAKAAASIDRATSLCGSLCRTSWRWAQAVAYCLVSRLRFAAASWGEGNALTMFNIPGDLVDACCVPRWHRIAIRGLVLFQQRFGGFVLAGFYAFT